MWSMNIINSARPRQQSMPSMRFAGAAMFPSSPIATIAPEQQSFISTDGENATVLRPPNGLATKGPLRLAAIAGGVRHVRVAAQTPDFARQNDGAPAFKLRLRRFRLRKS